MYTKPFLKWAGGKYRILGIILEKLPPCTRLVEPFAGSCAVYLNVNAPRALICDINADLISLYQHLQKEGDTFIAQCQTLFSPKHNSQEYYLDIRAEFNECRDPRRRGMLLLYLNRHGYNGLIRYNGKGKFNVPFGRYKKPYFPLQELQAFYAKTRQTDTSFACRDFRSLFAELRQGDAVYCDPPYVPLSSTAKFTSYAAKPFRPEDQQDLANLADAAREQGVPVLVSNHDTATTRALYAAAHISQFGVRRFISCHGQKREAAPELLALYR